MNNSSSRFEELEFRVKIDPKDTTEAVMWEWDYVNENSFNSDLPRNIDRVRQKHVLGLIEILKKSCQNWADVKTQKQAMEQARKMIREILEGTFSDAECDSYALVQDPNFAALDDTAKKDRRKEIRRNWSGGKVETMSGNQNDKLEIRFGGQSTTDRLYLQIAPNQLTFFATGHK